MAAAKLAPHHEAWLAAHPHRTRKWLKTAISEGFHIHHIDGDHDNNDSRNLVLIEATDHALLHSGSHHGLGFVAYGFFDKSWARLLRREAWWRRQMKEREACRMTMYWLEGRETVKNGGKWPSRVYKSDMAAWWKSWGGGRKWHRITSYRSKVFGVGLAELPRENNQLGVAFPYFADMDQDGDGWGRG